MLKKIDTVIDTDKPIIIVGWNKVKELYPNQKITNKVINDKICWTFSEKEKRNDNTSDLNKFKKDCIKTFGSKYRYFFLNPFEVGYGNTKKIISKIDQIGGKYYFFDDTNFFILVDDVIFGLNVNFLELTTLTENKIKTWLKSKEFEIFDKKQIFNIEEININHNTHLIPPIQRENIYEKEFIIGYILE
jgi:hypothetical protein